MSVEDNITHDLFFPPELVWFMLGLCTAFIKWDFEYAEEQAGNQTKLDLLVICGNATRLLLLGQ